MLGTGKSRGLHGVLGPRARLQSEGKRIASSWIFRTSWETPITQPPAPQQTTHTHTHTLYHLPAQGSRQTLRPAQVLFVEGAISAGGTEILPPGRGWGQECSAAPRTPSADGAASPRRCLPTPLTLPRRGFPLLSLLNPLAYNFA